MPSNNLATIAAGADVNFPMDGPNDGSNNIFRNGLYVFMLSNMGVYEVNFQVSVDEAGQLMLTLNGSEMDSTVVGRATGTSQIVGMCLIKTTGINSILTVRNPSGNSTALTITPNAGGARSVFCHLVIKQLS